MTPVFCCGLECGQLGSVGQHWISSLGSPTISTTTFRSGGRSLRINGVGVAAAATSIALPSSNNYVVRFYIYFATLPTSNAYLVRTSGANAGVFYQTSGTSIFANVGDGTLGSTGVAVTTGIWYLIDAKIDMGASPKTDVQVNGIACGQASGTGPGPSTAIICGVSGANTMDFYIDDILVSQTLADYPLGAGYVNHFVPTSDGTHNIAGSNDFEFTLTGTDILNATTTAYTLVDNIPLDSGTAASVGTFVNMLAPPNATDYVECIFGAAPGIGTPSYAPRAVEIIATIAQAGTGTGNMAILLRDNATSGTIYTATTVAGVTTYAYKRVHFATPPSGGSWGVASGNGNFNALRVRFGSPAVLDVNPDQYFSSIMIEAEFVAPVPNKIIQVKQAINRSNTF